MSLDRLKSAGPNFVPAYQISAVPFVTSSHSTTELGSGVVKKVEFPYATRFVVVASHGAGPIKVGFSLNGIEGKGGLFVSGSDRRSATTTSYDLLSSNYFVLTGTSPRIEVRCKEMYFARASGADTGFSLFAGLAQGIDQFPVLSGSNGFEGVG